MALIEIHTQEDSDDFKAEVLRKNVQDHSFWLGAVRDPIDTEFRWNTNGESMIYTNWNDGEPTNTDHSENCAVNWIEKSVNYWNDVNCDELKYTACYRPKYVKKCVVLPNYDYLYLTKSLLNENV